MAAGEASPGRIRYELPLARAGEGIRRLRNGVRPAHDPHGHEVLQTIVTDADHFVRFRLQALELRVLHVRVLALAVTRAEPRRGLRGGLHERLRPAGESRR